MATLTRSKVRPSQAKSKSAKSPKTARRRAIAPDDLLKFQLVSDPRISPDGRHIVFVRKHVGQKNEYLTNLWIVGTDGKSAPRQFTSGGKDHHPRWSPDGERIAFASGRDKPKPQIWTIPAGEGGGEATALTKLPEGALGDFNWAPDGKLIAASFREQDPEWTEDAKTTRKEKGLSDPPRVLDDWWYRLDGDGYFNGQRHHLYVIDAATGAHRKVYSGDTMGNFSFDWSPDSRQIVLATNRDKLAMTRPWKSELLLIDVARGKATPVPGLPEGPKESVAWSPDGKLLAYVGRAGREGIYTQNMELWVCDPYKGKPRNLTGQEDYCMAAHAISDMAEVTFSATIRWSPDSKRIFIELGWQGESHIASISASGGEINFHTPIGEGLMHGLGNIAGNGTPQVALTIGDALRPNEVYLGKLTAGSLKTQRLSDFNGKLLNELELVEPQESWIKTADGAKVHVWMIRPLGFKAGKKYPAILEIHGGPHAMYGCGFFHEFQVLAAQGHAVFYSNPRGSKGYGRDHCHAIRGSWGGDDWTDIQAVTQFMKKQPFVDRKRMGVMGGSYGGYMTNWVIGHTCDFKAAVTDRCVSNLVSMMGTSDFADGPDFYWPGNAWDRPEKLWEMSPLKYLGQCKTPTLIIHSEGDLRCNVEQAEQVFTALKHNNVPTRFVRYPASTSHGLSRSGPPDLRLHRLNQIVEWWRKWLA